MYRNAQQPMDALGETPFADVFGGPGSLRLVRSGRGSRRSAPPSRPDLPIPMPRVEGLDHIEAWFQPIYDLETGRATALEALLRGVRADGRLVSPDRILPASDPVLREEIDLFMLQAVLDHAYRHAAWDPSTALRFHVNVCPRHLQKETYLEKAEMLLRAFGRISHRLTLEVTENWCFKTDDVQEGMERLGETGVRYALDDFGSGYSSLQCLSHLPFRLVKLDRSLVRDVRHNPRTPVLLRGLLDLCDSLELDTVVEGIETAPQLAALHLLGCRQGQGFFLGRPAPARLDGRSLPRRPSLQAGPAQAPAIPGHAGNGGGPRSAAASLLRTAPANSHGPARVVEGPGKEPT